MKTSPQNLANASKSAADGGGTSRELVIPDLAVIMEPTVEATQMPDLEMIDAATLELVPPPASSPDQPKVPDLTVLIEPMEGAQMPDLAFVEESTEMPTVPDLAIASESTEAATMPDLAFVSESIEALARQDLAFATESEMQASVVGEPSSLRGEQGPAISQKEHEAIVAALKTEHQAALDRVREESAQAVEETKGEAQLHFGELVSQWDVQRDSLNAKMASVEREREADLAKSKVERDLAHKALMQIQAENVRLKGELTASGAKGEAAPAAKEPSFEWNGQAVATLEAEVETYRQRLKMILKQRDELAAANLELSQQVKAQAEAVAEQAPVEARPEASPQLSTVKQRLAELMAATSELALAVDAIGEPPANEDELNPGTRA